MKNKSADGLRGVAAFNVAIHHFVAAFLPMMLHNNYPSVFTENKQPSTVFELLTSPFFTLIYNGHFAVLIFFVLSGYVLSLPYYMENNKAKHTLSKRLLGRYLRLNIPIAAAIFLSFLFYKSGFYFNIQAAEISGSKNWLQNFYPQGISPLTTIKEALYNSILFGKELLVPPLWSLHIEFVGSVYVLLLYILKPKNSTLTPMLIVFILIYANNQQDSIYYFAIFFGSLLSKIEKSIKFRVVFLILGIYFGGFQFESIMYDFLPSLNFMGVDLWEKKNFYNCIGAVLITTAVIQGFGSVFFESRVTQFLGRISFSIYLLHFIVLCSFSSFFYIHLPKNSLFITANFIIYIFICFLFSIIFERFIDKSSIRISHDFSSKIFSLIKIENK